jgi:hypothetical protein
MPPVPTPVSGILFNSMTDGRIAANDVNTGISPMLATLAKSKVVYPLANITLVH